MDASSNARERLINAATELIYARGYNAVGVKEICSQAGVHRGSFYHFFPSKRDLALAVIDNQWVQFRQGFLDPIFAEEVPVLEKCRKVFHLVAEKARVGVNSGGQVKGCPIGNFASELSTQDEVIRQKLQEVIQCWTGYFEQALNEGVANGKLPDVNTSGTAQAIIAYFEGVSLLAKTYNDPDIIDRLAQALDQLVMS